jgi:DNA-binding CsgD family transcriptional regulator
MNDVNLQIKTHGNTYTEIAANMFLSPKTIDGYRTSLFDKLGIKSRVGL